MAHSCLEQFSIECRKTKTKVITTANQNKDKYHNEPMRSHARENASDQVAIGFSSASDWLRGWREFSRPITERSKAKPMQSWITFDTQLKIALTLVGKVVFAFKHNFTLHVYDCHWCFVFVFFHFIPQLFRYFVCLFALLIN